MKDFKRIVAPRVKYSADRELEDAVNRALEQLAQATNDAIQSLVRHIPQELSIWAEGEEVTLNMDVIYHANDKEVAVSHKLGVKPTRYLVLNRTPRKTRASPISGADRHDIQPSATPWTATHAYFYATEDAVNKNTEFKIVLLP